MSQATTQRTTALDRLYAKALFDLAQANGQLAEVADEAQGLQTLLADVPELNQVVESKVIRDSAKASFLQKVFEGKVSETTYKFLQVVNQKGRLVNLATILQAFAQEVDAAAGKQNVAIAVAQPLDDAALATVKAQLSAALNKDVSLTQSVDPSLIGGVVVKVGDRLIDGSVATRLKSIKSKLVQAGRQHARQFA